MKTELDLWKKRRNEYWKIALKYFSYIANSGFMFAIFLLLVFGGYYYGQLLDWLPHSFPTVLLFTIVFSWFITRGRVRTFVKEGDLFFLTPREGKMAPYFKASLTYSWLMETLWLSAVILIFAPLFFDRISESGSSLLAIFLFLSGLKWWNLACSFEEQRIQDIFMYNVHTLIRFGLNFVVAYALFSLQPIWLIGLLILILLFFYVGYFLRLSKTSSIKWDRLLQIENNTVMNFYRMANNFIDVPALKSKVKHRRWVSPIFKLVKYKKENVYHYLYIRAFTRAGDFFGIYVRLTLLCILFIGIVQIDWGRYFLVVLFSYMTVLQIETLKHHYATNHLVEIYPVSINKMFHSHRFLLYRLGFIQGLAFGIACILFHSAFDGIIAFLLTLVVYALHGIVRMPKLYRHA